MPLDAFTQSKDFAFTQSPLFARGKASRSDFVIGQGLIVFGQNKTHQLDLPYEFFPPDNWEINQPPTLSLIESTLLGLSFSSVPADPHYYVTNVGVIDSGAVQTTPISAGSNIPVAYIGGLP